MQFMILKEGERIKRKGYKISEEGENEGVRLELWILERVGPSHGIRKAIEFEGVYWGRFNSPVRFQCAHFGGRFLPLKHSELLGDLDMSS